MAMSTVGRILKNEQSGEMYTTNLALQRILIYVRGPNISTVSEVKFIKF